VSEAEPRPRPQYGEYASAEEQRARIARPEITDALQSGVRPADSDPAASPAAGTPRPAGSATGWRLADRFVTVGLLVYGLLNMVFTAPRLFDFADAADEYLALLGVQEPFTNVAAAHLWGPIAGTVYIAGFVATALLAWRRLRRGRIAFWIPLVGAFATLTVVAICLTVPLAGDRAFLAFVDGLSGR
jgi:hypothetical protein